MNRCFIAALTLCTMSMFGCKEDFKDPTIWDLRPCDPSRPIEFTDFYSERRRSTYPNVYHGV